MDFRSVFERGRHQAKRIKYHFATRQLARPISPRLLASLVLFGALCFAVVLFQLAKRTTIATDRLSMLFLFLGVFLGGYLVIKFLSQLDRSEVNERINRPSDVVEFYDERGCADDFIQMSDLPAWDVEDTIIDTVPGVPESIPSEPIPTEELTVTIEDSYFPLSDRVTRLYDPTMDTIREQFVENGLFNQIKLRPISVAKSDVTAGTTTFFNNFATNLSADYEIYREKSPRELLHTLVFDPEGQLRPLTETDLPYILSASGMIVGADGSTVFSVRNTNVVLEPLHLGLSFGGSWDRDIVTHGGPHEQIRKEMEEERGITDDMDVTMYYLGTVRRLDLLGKPDCFIIALVDSVPNWEDTSSEEIRKISVQLLPEGTQVEGIQTLMKHIGTVNERVFKTIEASPYPPSLGIFYCLYLLNHLSEKINDSILRR